MNICHASRVTFASCYVYSPSGRGLACERSRLLRCLLKERDARFLSKYAARVRQELSEAYPLAGFFRPATVLVPVPGSAPGGGGAASTYLAQALLDAGVGGGLCTVLHRAYAVRKSATAAPGSRPTVFVHYDSFTVEAGTELSGDVMLVDDIVTKGRTLLAAAARINTEFPGARVRAFALLRTMGLVSGVSQLIEPCIGEIRWRGGDAERVP